MFYSIPAKLQQSVSYFNYLIDENGILQFTQRGRKNFQGGYAIEDQARALILAIELQDQKQIELFRTICYSACPKASKFTAEARGELLWALGEYTAISQSASPDHFKLLLLQELRHTTSPRAIAYTLLGLVKWEETADVFFFADKLVALYERYSDPVWQWYEEGMYYANALLPWALWESYVRTKKERYKEVAQRTFDFLLQSLFPNGIPLVVGNQGWWKKHQQMSLFDQQPLDPAYLILAATRVFEITQDFSYLQTARIHYSWFFGNNILYTAMIREDGGCADGLTWRGPSLNAGAEAIVCFLLAAYRLEKILFLNDLF